MMKAIVRFEYGSPSVLQLRDIDKPTVKRGEVLVRVRAADPLAEAPEALRYLEAGHAQGKLVITV